MRNLFAMFSLFFSVLYFAQANPFAGENTDNSSSNRYSNGKGLDNPHKGKGGPGVLPEQASPAAEQAALGVPPTDGDDLPIDDYIPVFVMVALGMIVYQTRSVKKVQS